MANLDGKWRNLPNKLPEPRSSGQALYHNGWIYLVAGTKDAAGPAHGEILGSPVDSDGNLGLWRGMGVLPDTRVGHAQATFIHDGYLWSLGGTPTGVGRDGKVFVGKVGSDGSVGPFQTLGLVSPIDGHVAVPIGEWVYSIGGALTAGPTRLCHAARMANGKLGSWKRIGTDLPIDLGLFSRVVVGDWIYILGGSNVNGIYSARAHGGELTPWKLVGNLPQTSCRSMTAVLVGSTLVVVGGQTGVAGSLDSVCYAEVFPGGELGPIRSSVNKPPFGIRSAGTVLVKDKLYLIGGNDPAARLGTVLVLDGVK